MTYSRPTTSTVDALARVPTPNAPGILGDSRVTSSANGRVVDARNPGQIAANGRAQAAEVTSFIEGLTKTAQPLINSALTEKANNQVGELLKTQDPVQLMRNAKTPEGEAILRQLNPQARDILEDKAAAMSVRLYGEALTAETSKRSAILQSETATFEERTKAWSEAKSRALQVSGVSAMAPGSLLRYADQLGQYDAALMGLDYKATLAARDETAVVKWGSGTLSDIETQITPLLAGSKDRSAEDQATVIATVKGDFEQQIREQGAVIKLPRMAEQLYNSFITRVKALTSTEQYDAAQDLVNTFAVLSDANITAPNGLNFFDQRLPDGSTFRFRINELAGNLNAEVKRFEVERAVEDNSGLIRSALAGDENARAGLLQAVQGMTAQQAMALVGVFSQAENFGQQETAEQQRREANLRYDIARGRYNTPEAAWAAVQSAGLTPRQQVGLSEIAVRGGTESTRLVAGAREYLQAEMGPMAQRIAGAAGVTSEEGVRQIGTDLLNAASRATEKRIEEMQAKGQTVNVDQARDIFRNEMEAISNTRVKEAEKADSPYQNTPDRVLTRELQELRANIRNNGGEVTTSVFPQSTIRAFRAAFPDKTPTVPLLEKFMMTQMQQIKNNGQPVYADPQKTLRQIYRSGKEDGRQSQAPTQRYSNDVGAVLRTNPLAVLASKVQEIGQGAVDMLTGGSRPAAQSSRPPASASPTPQSQPQQSRSRPQPAQQQNPVVAMVNAGLQLVANSIAPPAAAGTLQDAPVVMENSTAAAVARLNSLWRGQERLSTQTPPLPQVAATTPVQMAPLRIDNVNHPMFVAIGIAEGTRTPNGGFTRAYHGHRDPGDGHNNRGTVSGGRGSNASPAQVDRQWMAQLTSRSVAVAPILQRVGLQPGTQGWNRVMFNVLDLTVQAPLAVQQFIAKLPAVVRAGATVEALAKARADSFFNPATGRLDARGFGNSYNALLSDQRSRAGVWDYRRRI